MKVDVETEDIVTSGDDRSDQEILRVGEHVILRSDTEIDTKYRIETKDGTVIAWISREILPFITNSTVDHTSDHHQPLPPPHAFNAHIRSIKRDTTTKTPTSILLRVTGEYDESIPLKEASRPHALNDDGRLHIEDPVGGASSFKEVTQEQFMRLAEDEGIRNYLRDEKLQRCLQRIDDGDDRERELIEASQSPRFKEFTDKILNLLSPDAQ